MLRSPLPPCALGSIVDMIGTCTLGCIVAMTDTLLDRVEDLGEPGKAALASLAGGERFGSNFVVRTRSNIIQW